MAEQPSLLRVGAESVPAALKSSDASGVLQFQDQEQAWQVLPAELVRWSTPRSAGTSSAIILSDGSRLVLAAAWLGEPVLRLDAEVVEATTKLLGEISFPRAQLKAILWNAPNNSLARTKWLDRLLAEKPQSDKLFMASSDEFLGTCSAINSAIQFTTEPSGQSLELPLSDKIAGLVLADMPRDEQQGKLSVGLRDGSVLHVSSLIVNSNELKLKLASGLQLTGDSLRDVVSLRSLLANVTYLSDLTAQDYRHVPYLDIPWAFSKDRNVLGSELLVAEKTFPKGIGMHSAGRLTYDLPNAEKKYERFAAEVALDDAAGRGRGSVVFRVYLRQGEAWQAAYSSPLMRGGDAPQPVSIELGTATKIALVVDYADRGDERDYANWLDARLE